MESRSPQQPIRQAGHAQSSQDSSKRQETSKRLGDLFCLLGSDPGENINIIVRHANEVIPSACSLYNRLNDKDNSLTCWSGHNLPENFEMDKSPNGHICYEATIKGDGRPVVIPDISKTPYQDSDKLVSLYGLKSYLGHPVRCDNAVIGSLAVVDTQTREFDQTDIYYISALAKALSVEEDRKNIESALRQSENNYLGLYKMLRLLADNMPDPIWAKDMNNRYLFANQATCDKLLKCGHPDNITGKTDLDFTRKQRDAGYEHTYGDICIESDEIIKQKRTPGRFLEEGLIQNQQFVLDVHKAPFWGPDGELIGTVGCGRDVTKEKQIEKAFLDSELRYRNLYNNMPVMLCSLDAEFRLTSVSNLWLESLGYDRDKILGRPIFEFFSEQSRRDALEYAFPELFKTGYIKSQPFTFLTLTGERKSVQFSAVADKDTDGQYTGALAFAVDTTESERSELEKNRLSARLQQAQKMETIATLAGGVAHQFNNALAVIMGNLELIKMDGKEDEKLNLYLDPIGQAGQKMVQLTGQLLAYARGGKFQTQVIAAHQFVTETLLLVKHSLAPYVELVTNIDEDADHIEVDLTQMQMLLAAIFSNASEAIEKQGRVRISLTNTEVDAKECEAYPGLKPGKYVLMSIVDNGKGMEEQTRQRIFEPFFTTKFQGRGLGMAAVYGIVKKHDGYVYIDSVAGKGTIVSIFLKGVKAEQRVVEEAVQESVTRSGTALIVEDEHLVMEVNRAIVEKLGYNVLEARTGEEAIKISNEYEGRIDFVLLDVILPDMDSSHVYPLLIKVRPDLKVIVCSGFALDGPARQILDSGAESFVQKPFTVAALSAVLKKIFKEEDEA